MTERIDICPDCYGCGWDDPAHALYKCSTCNGSGVIEREHAPDGEKCWCGRYHPTDEEIGIY